METSQHATFWIPMWSAAQESLLFGKDLSLQLNGSVPRFRAGMGYLADSPNNFLTPEIFECLWNRLLSGWTLENEIFLVSWCSRFSITSYPRWRFFWTLCIMTGTGRIGAMEIYGITVNLLRIWRFPKLADPQNHEINTEIRSNLDDLEWLCSYFRKPLYIQTYTLLFDATTYHDISRDTALKNLNLSRSRVELRVSRKAGSLETFRTCSTWRMICPRFTASPRKIFQHGQRAGLPQDLVYLWASWRAGGWLVELQGKDS